MPQLNSMVDEYKTLVAAANHCLLIGATKSGKTDWVAQAAIDGFDIFYVDNDNGLATLMERLKDHPEALARVHYVNPVDFIGFFFSLMRAAVIRFNERTREIYVANKAKPEDEIIEIRPMRIAKARNVIVAFDSWTTLCYSALKDAAKAQGVELTQIDKYGREIYGPAGFKIEQAAQMLQLAPFNFIMQAHPAIYEIKEKPPGVARDITEKDMIIKETWEVPQSTSGPNGFKIGKYFNQIGWLELDRFDKFKLSFKQKNRRISGGTPGGIGDPRVDYTYRKLFGKGLELPLPMDSELPWIRRLTVAEYQAESAAAKPTSTAPASPSAPEGGTPQLSTKPAGLKLGGLKKG